MLTQVEALSACSPSSLPCEDGDQAVRLRRHELTNIFLREKRYFLRIAGSILRNDADAEDAVHSAFCSAWKAIGAFRGESSIKTWLSRIVSNHAIVDLKKRNRLTFLDDNPECLHSLEQTFDSRIDGPEAVLHRQEELDLMQKHMERLPVETRIVLRLYLSNDGSIETVAALRGKSRPAISLQLHRGKVMLRKSVHSEMSRRRGCRMTTT